MNQQRVHTMPRRIKINLTAQEKADEAALNRWLGPVDPKRRARQLAAEKEWEARRRTHNIIR
jgi:hypothetical protein